MTRRYVRSVWTGAPTDRDSAYAKRSRRTAAAVSFVLALAILAVGLIHGR